MTAIARQWDFDAPVVALAVNRNGDYVAAALGDGSLRLFHAYGDSLQPPREIKLHDGVSLSLVPDADAHTFLSGGDDGKIFIIDPAGTPVLIADHKGQWIDHVASSPGDFRAYTKGKAVHLLDAEGGEKIFAAPSSAGGLAFSPKGKRLAASHYNGVSLWWTVSKDSEPVRLPWKGSHLGVIWHPEGKILVTALQENALHGWRLSDSNEMRMEGYAAKIHSMGFSAKGRYLATSGAPQVICWPFFGGGPWGKTPLTLGAGEMRLVTQVAPHPRDELIAAGYDDGMIVLAPLDGRSMEIMIHVSVAAIGAAVTGLAWNAAGDCLYAGLENGTVMLFTLESVKQAVIPA